MFINKFSKGISNIWSNHFDCNINWHLELVTISNISIRNGIPPKWSNVYSSVKLKLRHRIINCNLQRFNHKLEIYNPNGYTKHRNLSYNSHINLNKYISKVYIIFHLCIYIVKRDNYSYNIFLVNETITLLKIFVAPYGNLSWKFV